MLSLAEMVPRESWTVGSVGNLFSRVIGSFVLLSAVVFWIDPPRSWQGGFPFSGIMGTTALVPALILWTGSRVSVRCGCPSVSRRDTLLPIAVVLLPPLAATVLLLTLPLVSIPGLLIR